MGFFSSSSDKPMRKISSSECPTCASPQIKQGMRVCPKCLNEWCPRCLNQGGLHMPCPSCGHTQSQNKC